MPDGLYRIRGKGCQTAITAPKKRGGKRTLQKAAKSLEDFPKNQYAFLAFRLK
jgi:hypothetical protein